MSIVQYYSVYLSKSSHYRNIPFFFLIIIHFSSEEQLDFPVLYASAKEGWASTTFTKDPPADARNMAQLLDAILRHVPPPTANLDAPFQMMVGIYAFVLKEYVFVDSLLCGLARKLCFDKHIMLFKF